MHVSACRSRVTMRPVELPFESTDRAHFSAPTNLAQRLTATQTNVRCDHQKMTKIHLTKVSGHTRYLRH